LIVDVSTVHALLLGSRARGRPHFFFVTRHKTAAVFSRGHRSRTVQICLEVSFICPLFENALLVLRVFLRVSSSSVALSYTPHQLPRNEMLLLQKTFSNNYSTAEAVSRETSDQSSESNFALFRSKIKKQYPPHRPGSIQQFCLQCYYESNGVRNFKWALRFAFVQF